MPCVLIKTHGRPKNADLIHFLSTSLQFIKNYVWFFLPRLSTPVKLEGYLKKLWSKRMQNWPNLRKNVHPLALFALVSLLSACASTPQKNTLSPQISASPTPSSAVTQASPTTHTPDAYYDATGLLTTPDDIEALLGVTEMDAVTYTPEELASFGDVWERTRAGFKLSITDNERIAKQVAWFSKRQDYLNRLTARASHYLYHTVTEAEKAGVPTELALLPIIESSYDPFATSPAQAAGIWQFIPSTGKSFGLRQTWWYDGRRDTLESTRAAYQLLTQLYNQFGSWELALASYNWGSGNIQKAIDRNLAAGLPTDYWSLRMPAETQDYVPRFLAVVQVIKNPKNFGVHLNPIVNKAHFRETYAKNQVDLNRVAKIAGLTTKQLYQLNPAYMRWATNPDGPHRVLVPVETPEIFEAQLAALPAPDRYITVSKRYVAKKKETLQRIAAKFGTSVAAIKRLNGKIASKRGYVVAGSSLVVARHKQLVPSDTVVNNIEIADNTETADTPEIVKLANPAAKRVAQLEKAAKEKEAKEASSRKQNSDENTAKKYHKVRAGQSLFAIAQKYDVSTKDLATWNKLKSTSKLKAGTKLLIISTENEEKHEKPVIAHTEKSSKNKKNRLANNDDSPKKNKKEKEKDKDKDKDKTKRISYEVKRGDTLFSISQRYNVSVSQIKAWNKAAKNLKPGQDIVIYLAKS